MDNGLRCADDNSMDDPRGATPNQRLLFSIERSARVIVALAIIFGAMFSALLLGGAGWGVPRWLLFHDANAATATFALLLIPVAIILVAVRLFRR